MTNFNNNNSITPYNYRKPTREELAAQIQREKDQSALGRIKAQQKLQKQKESMDYSRSEGGSRLLDNCLTMTAAAITDRLDMSLKRAGQAASYIGPIYKRLKDTPLVNLPKLDSDGNIVTTTDEEGNELVQMNRKSERRVDLWDEGEIAFIVLLTLIDTCQMPLLGTIEKQSKSGKRHGTRPNVYKLESLISDRVNDHLAHKYIRECTKNTGNDRLIDFILADSYDNQASALQKKTNTRRMRKQRAEEFIAQGMTPMAEVLKWRPFTNREGHALAAALISGALMGCEEVLQMQVFEKIDRFNSQNSRCRPRSRGFVARASGIREGSPRDPLRCSGFGSLFLCLSVRRKSTLKLEIWELIPRQSGLT